MSDWLESGLLDMQHRRRLFHRSNHVERRSILCPLKLRHPRHPEQARSRRREHHRPARITTSRWRSYPAFCCARTTL